MSFKHETQIRIGFPLSLSGGGPSIFMKRLRESIYKQRLAKVSFFINPFNDIDIFSNLARDIYGKPYIFRVDGICFDKKEIDKANNLKNKPIFDGIDRAAGIVFQSRFDYKLVTKFYGKIDKPYEIINNGVDINIFSPEGSNKRKDLSIADNDLVFITSAKWRAHKRLQDAIELFIEYEKNSDRTCHLLILGRDANFENVAYPHIYHVGFVQPGELPAWYRTGNIFLFLSWLDHCPNTVIEALACGLPVVCTNQGGTKELVELTNGGIAAEADREFNFEPVELYNPPKPDYQRILDAINRIITKYDNYVMGMDKSKINIDYVAINYYNFIERVLTTLNKESIQQKG